MYCEFCGRQIDEDASFCPYCGQNQKNQTRQPCQTANGDAQNPTRARQTYGYQAVSNISQNQSIQEVNPMMQDQNIQQQNAEVKKFKVRYIVMPVTLFFLIAGVTCAVLYFHGFFQSDEEMAASAFLNDSGDEDEKNADSMLTGTTITYQIIDESWSEQELTDTIDKLRQRVQSYGTGTIVWFDSEYLNVFLPGEYETDELEYIGESACIQFASDSGITDDKSTDEDESVTVWLDNADIAYAEADEAIRTAGTSDSEKTFVINLRMTTDGTKKLEEATRELYGQTIRIEYNGKQLSEPVVTAVVSDGKVEISGFSSYEEASRVAEYLNIGALELELEQISLTVGECTYSTE